jgi:hypothetical protein
MSKYAAAWIALGLAATLGCHRESTKAVSQVELDRAQAALQAALDAWKRGSSPGPIQRQVAAVTDPDWAGGLRLENYMIYSADGTPGEQVRCGVALSLRDKQGQVVMKDVFYSLSGDAPFVIAREGQK